MELLAADVVLVGDGGGKAPARREPLYGRDRVARFLAEGGRLLQALQVRFTPVEINGQPGAITLDRDGRIVNVVSLDIAGGAVQAIRSVLNPDKLHHLGPVADLWRLVREAQAGGLLPT